MKRSKLALLLALVGSLCGCRDNAHEAREFLVAHGFKQSSIHRDIYELKKVRLADASREIGFPLPLVQHVPSQTTESDLRIAEAHGLYFVIESEVRDKDGRIVHDSLDDPDALCTVHVTVHPPKPREYRKTDSNPRMHVKSVSVPTERSKPLEVTFDLAADGTTPLALSQHQFGLIFTMQRADRQAKLGLQVTFPEGSPEPITVSPGKAITLTVAVSGGACASWDPVNPKPWADLPAGQYSLSVGVGTAKLVGSGFDYHWQGVKFSDEYEFSWKRQ